MSTPATTSLLNITLTKKTEEELFDGEWSCIYPTPHSSLQSPIRANLNPRCSHRSPAGDRLTCRSRPGAASTSPKPGPSSQPQFACVRVGSSSAEQEGPRASASLSLPVPVFEKVEMFYQAGVYFLVENIMSGPVWQDLPGSDSWVALQSRLNDAGRPMGARSSSGLVSLDDDDLSRRANFLSIARMQDGIPNLFGACDLSSLFATTFSQCVINIGRSRKKIPTASVLS
jgi:hypothetical protein